MAKAHYVIIHDQCPPYKVYLEVDTNSGRSFVRDCETYEEATRLIEWLILRDAVDAFNNPIAMEADQ